MRLKILLAILILGLGILIISILQWTNKIDLPCLNKGCPLGGVCTKFNGRNLCLNGRNVNELCDNYCEGKKCRIGIDKPLTINC